jgi:transglutaminase-like putative cysteine protease
MEYDVRHRTTYRYLHDVSYSCHVAHLTPRETVVQQVGASKITLSVAPTRRDRRTDYFGNAVEWFAIDQPHSLLEILSESHVQVETAPQDIGAMRWTAVKGLLEAAGADDARDATQYLFDSPLVGSDAAITAYAAKSFASERTIADAGRDLMHRIHKDFRYDATVTDASTPAARVFEIGAGVCQDFAHAGVACARAFGLSARYVSGYLVTKPPPGKPRLIGADASHAWFSLWTPEGWMDFDPTNDMCPGDGHITMAWGRDYSDVAPINGIVSGGGDHVVEVGVDVAPAQSGHADQK